MIRFLIPALIGLTTAQAADEPITPPSFEPPPPTLPSSFTTPSAQSGPSSCVPLTVPGLASKLKTQMNNEHILTPDVARKFETFDAALKIELKKKAEEMARRRAAGAVQSTPTVVAKPAAPVSRVSRAPQPAAVNAAVDLSVLDSDPMLKTNPMMQRRAFPQLSKAIAEKKESRKLCAQDPDKYERECTDAETLEKYQAKCRAVATLLKNPQYPITACN